MNLDLLSDAELHELIVEANNLVAKRKRNRITAVRKEIREAAKAEGFTIEELFGIGQVPAAKSSLPAKYRHPDDASLTWSGRGRRPAWFEKALAAHGEQALLA